MESTHKQRGSALGVRGALIPLQKSLNDSFAVVYRGSSHALKIDPLSRVVCYCARVTRKDKAKRTAKTYFEQVSVTDGEGRRATAVEEPLGAPNR